MGREALRPGDRVTGVVVAHQQWGLDLLLDGHDVKATVDLRFIANEPAVIGNPDRWPAVGQRVDGVFQGTMPASGQLRVSLLIGPS